MPYPIITPEFFAELTDPENPENENVEYSILTSPAAVEYIFHLNEERVIRKLMDTTEVMSYKMRTLKPEAEEEYNQRSKEMIEKEPKLKYYWSIKSLTMNVLQNRNYVFEKRMLLLNFAYKTIQGMIDQKKEEYILPFISDFCKKEKYDDVMKYFESISPNPALSLSDGLSLMRSMPKTDEWNSVLDDAFKAIGTSKDFTDFEYDREKYMPIKKAYYDEFLKGKEHYIEQIMVNYVWTYCMPYADLGLDLWENFIFFNILFNAIKVLLTLYTYGKEDKDAAFVKAIAAFDSSLRMVKGSPVKHIVHVNSEAGLNNNGDMAILSMS